MQSLIFTLLRNIIIMFTAPRELELPVLKAFLLSRAGSTSQKFRSLNQIGWYRVIQILVTMEFFFGILQTVYACNVFSMLKEYTSMTS